MPISLPPEAEVERLLAMTTPSPSPHISLSPPSAEERLARCIAPPAHLLPLPMPSPLLPSSGSNPNPTLKIVSTQDRLSLMHVTGHTHYHLLSLPPTTTYLYTYHHQLNIGYILESKQPFPDEFRYSIELQTQLVHVYAHQTQLQAGEHSQTDTHQTKHGPYAQKRTKYPENNTNPKEQYSRIHPSKWMTKLFAKTLPMEMESRTVRYEDTEGNVQTACRLTLICTKFVANETEKVDKYISGLPNNIYGNVKSARPKTLDETIELTNDLMDTRNIRPYAKGQSTQQKGRLMNSSRHTSWSHAATTLQRPECRQVSLSLIGEELVKKMSRREQVRCENFSSSPMGMNLRLFVGNESNNGENPRLTFYLMLQRPRVNGNRKPGLYLRSRPVETKIDLIPGAATPSARAPYPFLPPPRSPGPYLSKRKDGSFRMCIDNLIFEDRSKNLDNHQLRVRETRHSKMAFRNSDNGPLLIPSMPLFRTDKRTLRLLIGVSSKDFSKFAKSMTILKQKGIKFERGEKKKMHLVQKSRIVQCTNLAYYLESEAKNLWCYWMRHTRANVVADARAVRNGFSIIESAHILAMRENVLHGQVGKLYLNRIVGKTRIPASIICDHDGNFYFQFLREIISESLGTDISDRFLARACAGRGWGSSTDWPKVNQRNNKKDRPDQAEDAKLSDRQRATLIDKTKARGIRS
ncbi:hypothetical protein Tco_0801674 [Tanacetum coccineum]|uniref:Uncharacterized protein n=1 Tax=Tanacetum coccineum TaxID=301880 RepID=A0ABQ4ZYY2_9ASTR